MFGLPVAVSRRSRREVTACQCGISFQLVIREPSIEQSQKRCGISFQLVIREPSIEQSQK